MTSRAATATAARERRAHGVSIIVTGAWLFGCNLVVGHLDPRARWTTVARGHTFVVDETVP